jgi:Zinc carboxypeptidase
MTSYLFAALLAAAPMLPQQAIDTTYARLVREATTDARFLPASVATLPDVPSVPSPLDFFGTIAGAPGTAHSAEELYGYYRALAEASPRVAVEPLNSSEGGREIILVVVSDEETIRGLDRVRSDMAALADPRVTSRAEMERIVARAKPVYLVEAGQHSAEMGPPEMVPELAYRLAVSDDPIIREIRSKVVTLINPVQGPDGRDRQVEWYERYTRGRPYDDGFPRSVPYWGEYIYHDNNRDGIQMTSRLTQSSYKMFWKWHPVVMHDLHESVPMLYVSMGTGPYNAHIDPITVTEWQTLAQWDVQRMTAQGAPGVWTWGYYDAWWPGYQTWIGANHNGLGRFFETLGNSSADTYERDLSGSSFAGDPALSRQWYRAWPPDTTFTWSQRDNTNYMEAGVLSALEYASRNGDIMLRNFWQKGFNSLEKGRSQPPYAYEIAPLAAQRDPGRAAYLINQLGRHGIEVHRDPADGRFLVLLDQPYRNFAVDLLGIQEYPEDADFPAPDVAWTLGLIYGVDVSAIDDPGVQARRSDFVDVTAPVDWTGDVRAARDGDGTSWLMRFNGAAELIPALVALHEAEPAATVAAASAAFHASGEEWGAGTLVFRGLSADGADGLAARGLSLVGAPVPEVELMPVDLPRVAVYHTWFSTQDDGWVRYWFDQMGVPYSSIDKDDLRAGDLRSRFDVILVSNARGDATRWTHGIDPKFGPIAYTRTDEYPAHGTPDSTDDMTGGPGFQGLAELERFLDEGGTVITMVGSSQLVAGTGIVRGLSLFSPDGLTHPTSVVSARVTGRDSPLAFGFDTETHLLRGGGPLLRASGAPEGSVVLRYGAGDGRPYVLSGMVRGEEAILDKPALLDLPAGRGGAGRVIAFSFNPLHRYLNHHDARLVFNALLFWNDGKPSG